MTSPIDAALMSKEAFFGRQLSLPGMGPGGHALMQGAKRTAGGAALLAGGIVLAEGAKQLMSAVTKKRDFREMMDNNPDLEGAQQENPKLFNSAYNSLRRLNPAYAREPLVAGGILRQVMENPVNAGGILTSTVRDPDAGGGGGGRLSLKDLPLGLGVQQDV